MIIITFILFILAYNNQGDEVMKKKIFSLIALSALLTACGNVEQIKEPKVVMPSGAPLIALSNYLINHTGNYQIANGGAQELIAEFSAEEANIIAAPINLGAIRYNAKPIYGLYKTLVWDNLYILSKEEITSIEDLAGKKIIWFRLNTANSFRNYFEFKICNLRCRISEYCCKCQYGLYKWCERHCYIRTTTDFRT